MKMTQLLHLKTQEQFKAFRRLSFLMVIVAMFEATPTLDAQARRCVVDREMWTNGGGDGFGANGVLGQTFTITAPGQVCKIELMIHKNDPAAGDLRVVLRDANLNPIPFGTVILRAANIPLGLSPQTIDFCCNQMPLLPAAGATTYGLTLSATTSAPAAYTWINHDVGGPNAFPFGSGYGNVNGGAPNTPWIPAAYDYAFKIHMCRP